MNILPSCSHYLRRLLKQTIDSQNVPDLFQASQGGFAKLEERLGFFYPSDYSYGKVILQLERLIYSHQHAQTHRDQLALEDITSQILWWLGYGITIHPANAKVLVVDDTIETLKLVTALLSKAGFSVDSALNGQLALAKIQSLNPDLILLDINLPDMNGYQVYQKLQASSKTASIPVVFLSGADSIEPVQQSKNRVGYLAKPFKPQALIKCVNRYLKPCSPGESLTHDVLENELKNRRSSAQRLICLTDAHLSGNGVFYDREEESTHFFRTTLDGRYLRVSQSFAELCGYDSSEDMISKVTSLWHQVYDHAIHQEHWVVCFQSPNEVKTWSAKLKTQQNRIVDVVEKVCLIQDSYNRPLFYQGHVKLA